MLVVILKGIHAMNKKGMTLMEVIISIAMLSVALVFMYGLMVNLQHNAFFVFAGVSIFILCLMSIVSSLTQENYNLKREIEKLKESEQKEGCK